MATQNLLVSERNHCFPLAGLPVACIEFSKSISTLFFFVVLDVVATNSEADAHFFGLVGLEGGDDAKVSRFAIFGHGSVRDEEHGLCSLGHVGLDSLSEVSDFVCCSLDPFFAIWTDFELVVL